MLTEKFDSVYDISIWQSFKDSYIGYDRGIAFSPVKVVIVSVTWWHVGVTESQNQLSVFEIAVRCLQ